MITTNFTTVEQDVVLSRHKQSDLKCQQTMDRNIIISPCSVTILEWTRRAWVAPARDGSYVLGQLRSRTAGVSFRSILDAIVNHLK